VIDETKMKQAVRALVEAAHPERVILFGSYARGEAREDSDLDLLVIEREVPDKAKEMVRLRRVLRPLRIPVDVLVVSVAEVEDIGYLPGTPIYWALREGRALHG
jgi:predicted nucleotidyltransferase